VVVQIRDTGVTVNAVLHLLIYFPIAADAKTQNLPFPYLHILLRNDSRVEHDCEYIEKIDHGKCQNVNNPEYAALFVVIPSFGCYVLHYYYKYAQYVDKDDAWKG
jgi:hypothetical protein